MTQNQPKNTLYDHLLQSVKENKIQLPTQPSIFISLQKISQDPDVTSSQLCQIIGKDPALAGRIMSIANSPVMRGSVSISSLDFAVNRLGVRFVTYVSMGLALKQLFNAKNKPIEERMQFIWEHSGKVAASAYVLAKSLRLFPPEEVMLAGLVHEIGKLPILTFADQKPEYFNNLPLLDQTVTTLHPRLGKSILTFWKFPEEIACVPENVADLNFKSAKPVMSDIIQVAKQHVLHHGTPEGANGEFEQQENPAYNRLEIDQLLDAMAIKNMKRELTTHQQLFS